MYFRRVYDLRVDHDKTQKQIAEEVLHCNLRVYGRYERGQTEIPASMLLILSDYYGVTMDYLTGKTDNPKGMLLCKE